MNNIKSIYDLREQELDIQAGQSEKSLSSLVFTTPGTSWNDTFIEVSMPVDATGTRESRKLNLGKILDYIIAQLNKLADAQTTGDWLTKTVADTLYLGLKTGGTVEGPIIISNGTDVALDTGEGSITTANITASTNITAESKLTAHEVEVETSLTIGSSTLKNGSITLNGSLTVEGDSILNGNITNDEGNYSAEFNSVSATSIADSGNLTVDGTVKSGGKLTVDSGGVEINGTDGNLKVNGTVKSGGKLTVDSGGAEITGSVSTGALITNGSLKVNNGGAEITGGIKLKDTDDSNGKITFGDSSTSPYIEKRDNKIYMTSANIGTVIVGSENITGGSATIHGPLIVNGQSTLNGNIVNKNVDGQQKYSATFQDISTSSITDSGSLTVTGDSSLCNSGLTVTKVNETNSKTKISGNSCITGKIYFGPEATSDYPYIENKSNEKLYMSTVEIGSATIGTFDGAGESRTVLTVKGDLNNGITNTKTTINRAVFLNEVDAPKFVSPYFILAGDSVNYPEKDCGIDNSSGFYQGSGVGNGNAQLTAQAACWS